MTIWNLSDEVLHIKSQIKGHKCRIDSHRPAGGGQCNLCQAEFALQKLHDALKRPDNILSPIQAYIDTKGYIHWEDKIYFPSKRARD
jgi:hypothetical protein